MRITMIAFGTRGDVQPAVALGKVLKTKGHSVRILAGADFKWVSKWHGMTNVIRFCLRPVRILVDENDLAPHALHHERIRGCCADESTPYNSNLHHAPFPWSNRPMSAMPG